MDFNPHPLIKKKTPLLDKQFAEWWFAVNGVGLVSFNLFLGSLGAGDYRYLCSLLSAVFVIWLAICVENRFPSFVKKLRKSKNKADKKFAKEIVNDYLPWHVIFLYNLGFVIGVFSLFIFLLYGIWSGGLAKNVADFIQAFMSVGNHR